MNLQNYLDDSIDLVAFLILQIDNQFSEITFKFFRNVFKKLDLKKIIFESENNLKSRNHACVNKRNAFERLGAI